MESEVKNELIQAFNDMPHEYRKIAANAEVLARINDLVILRNRLRENYTRELNYVNERINTLEKHLPNLLTHEPTTINQHYFHSMASL